MRIEQVVFAWSDLESRPAARLLGRTANIHPADLERAHRLGTRTRGHALDEARRIQLRLPSFGERRFRIGRTGAFYLPVRHRQRATDQRTLALYTHCLIISPDDALRHARHFPLILREAENNGAFRRGAEPPMNMEPIRVDRFRLAAAGGKESTQFASPSPAATAAKSSEANPAGRIAGKDGSRSERGVRAASPRRASRHARGRSQKHRFSRPRRLSRPRRN